MNVIQQGYFIGLFLRFLWYLFLFTIFHTVIVYIFGYNFFTYYIISFIFSFLINTALPISGNYPFLRHGLILMCILFLQFYISDEVYRLNDFFEPDFIWIILIISSFIVGIFYSMVRYGNGSMKSTIETICSLILLALIVLSFVLYWWEGGLVYLVIRILLTFVELIIANLIFTILAKVNDVPSHIDN